MMIYKFLNRENARCFTKRIFFAGYSIDTGYVTKINLKTSPICHNVKASPKTTVAQDHVCPHGSAFRQSRHTINLSNNWLTVIRWGETISKITTLLYLDLCVFTFIFLWARHWFTLRYTQRMQFNLSIPYSIDGPAFLLTQVCLLCTWVLIHNGQITVHVREHFPHSTNKTFISVWHKEWNWICLSSILKVSEEV